MATFDRPPVIERLHSNVGKRKSTTPQKFVGAYELKQSVNGFLYLILFGVSMKISLMHSFI